MVDRRILSVRFGSFPNYRMKLVAQHLASANFRTDIFATGCIDPAPEWSFGNVHRVRKIPLLSRLYGRVRSEVLRSVGSIHPHYFHELCQLIESGDYCTVIFNDLPGATALADVCRQNGVRIVIDMHENYPYNMWSTGRDSGKRNWRNDIAEWFEEERAVCEVADAILVNTSEMAQRLRGMHYLDFRKTFVVRHAEEPAVWEGIEPSSELVAKYAGRFVLLYVGSCSRHRGIDVIVSALPIVRETISNVCLVIVGDGVGVSEWRSQAQALGVEDIVSFEGWKPFEEAQQFYQIADIGLIPHHKYGQTDNTVPHKFAQNMCNGLPQLVSSCHTLQSLINQFKCGLTFEAGNPADAARAIIEMQSSDYYNIWSENGYSAVYPGAEYSWEKMGERIEDAIKFCLGSDAK